MAQLSDYRVLSFDVYGTLVDWENGILSALQPMLDKNPVRYSRNEILSVYEELEREEQKKSPDLPYSQLLAKIHSPLVRRLGLPMPTSDDDVAFGASVGSWPAFTDTVDSLKRLSKHYKMVVLSNVDRQSFTETNANALDGFQFDLVITAQDMGSYKPDPRNFDYMLNAVQRAFDFSPAQVLQTAQSQFHDHQPAHHAGIKSVWIERPGAIIGNSDTVLYDWKFATLADMAAAVDNEFS
jgi:2-haloalkanoic acid dehalogenase type II